jgi:hypothetical protein
MSSDYNSFRDAKNKSKLPFTVFLFPDISRLNRDENSENEMNENLVEDIISSLDPDLLPWIYIDLAFVTGLDGIEREVQGNELYTLLNHPALDKVALGIQVLMDRKRLKYDISHAIDEFWEEALSNDTSLDDEQE